MSDSKASPPTEKRISDAEILRLFRQCDFGTLQMAAMFRDVGPYEITEPRPAFRDFVNRLAAALAPEPGACVCGNPTVPGVVHRKDGPCYQAEPASLAWLDDEEFFNYCQAYRCAPITDQAVVQAQFDALRRFIRRALTKAADHG